MNTDKVQAYIDQQVMALSDRRIKPVMDAINSELEGQRRNEAEKTRLDGLNKESNDRITKFQSELVKAKAEVADLANKLSATVAGAADSSAA